MNYFKLPLLIFALFHSSHCQEYVLPLWNGNVPNRNDIGITETSDTTEIVLIKTVDRPDITIYLPSPKSATGKAVIIVPGGGYNVLAYHWEGTDIAKWLNSRGIAAIVLKYRLPHTANNITGRLSPFLDLQRAVRLTRHYAEKWRIDKNKVGVMGFSAGGHLAATLGTRFDEKNLFNTDAIDSVSCRPDFMILIYPVITMREPYLHRGSRHFLLGDNPSPTLVNYYSNELHVTKNTPPVFLIHAGDDPSVPVENSLLFYRKLRQNNVPAEMHIYPQGGHGFSLAIGRGHISSWTDRCIEWINMLE